MTKHYKIEMTEHEAFIVLHALDNESINDEGGTYARVRTLLAKKLEREGYE